MRMLQSHDIAVPYRRAPLKRSTSQSRSPVFPSTQNSQQHERHDFHPTPAHCLLSGIFHLECNHIQQVLDNRSSFSGARCVCPDIYQYLRCNSSVLFLDLPYLFLIIISLKRLSADEFRRTPPTCHRLCLQGVGL